MVGYGGSTLKEKTMGSCTISTKGGAMTGSKLPKVGMSSSKSNNASAGNKGSANTSSSNMKK